MFGTNLNSGFGSLYSLSVAKECLLAARDRSCSVSAAGIVPGSRARRPDGYRVCPKSLTGGSGLSPKRAQSGRSPTVDGPKEAVVGLLKVSVDDVNFERVRAGTSDALLAGMHLCECHWPASAIEKDGRVTVFWTPTVFRAALESFCGLRRPW